MHCADDGRVRRDWVMSAWLLVLGAIGVLLPVVVGIAAVAIRIRTLPAGEQPAAERHARRFGLGVIGGIVGGTLISAAVIVGILLLRWLLRR